MMLDAFDVTEETWRDALEHGAPPGFAQSESPRYVGRAVAALAADRRPSALEPAVGRRPRALAGEYGFTDVDGSQPDAWSVI